MRHALTTPTSWQLELTLFATWMRAASHSESTIGLRLYHLRRFAATTALPPFDVTTATLEAYLGSRSWATSTRNSHRASLRAFYSWACLHGHMATSPAATLPSARAVMGRPRPAPERAVTAGLSAADVRVRLMVELGACAGLRCCEIATVHSSDVVDDLFGWSLRVLGKGNKIRTVPLGESLARRLLAHDGWVFPGNDRGHLSASYVSKLISRALPDGVTAHMLRHRFASRAYSADGDIRAVQELLGHASVATTQVYTAVPDHHLRRAVAAAA